MTDEFESNFEKHIEFKNHVKILFLSVRQRSVSYHSQMLKLLDSFLAWDVEYFFKAMGFNDKKYFEQDLDLSHSFSDCTRIYKLKQIW